MGKRVFLLNEEEPKEYLFHNHGIAFFCKEKGIGELTFHYPKISVSDLAGFGFSDREVTEMIFDGELIEEKDGDNLEFMFNTPVSVTLTLDKDDISLIKEHVENETDEGCENLTKMLEQNEMRQFDQYQLLVELSNLPF